MMDVATCCSQILAWNETDGPEAFDAWKHPAWVALNCPAALAMGFVAALCVFGLEQVADLASEHGACVRGVDGVCQHHV